MHSYKIIEMLKQFKIITLAPTCFGSRRSHHQGVVLCLTKSTIMVFCARRYRRSQCCAGVRRTARTHNRLICVIKVHQLEQLKVFLILYLHGANMKIKYRN